VFDPLTIAIPIAYYNLLVNIWPRRPQTVRDLKVWQKSMDLVEVCYRFSATLAIEERFGLVPQIRRAVTSVPVNIAEDFGRWNAREFGRFLGIACGSLRGLETHVMITQRLGFVSGASVASILRVTDELAKMMFRMHESVMKNAEMSEKLGRSKLVE
jgi:four helix bundle protein